MVSERGISDIAHTHICLQYIQEGRTSNHLIVLKMDFLPCLRAFNHLAGNFRVADHYSINVGWQRQLKHWAIFFHHLWEQTMWWIWNEKSCKLSLQRGVIPCR